MSTSEKPRCGYTIEGPKYGRRVVMWRRSCRRIVRNEGDRCWQHSNRWSQKPARSQ